jgi:hypothetical protein
MATPASTTGAAGDLLWLLLSTMIRFLYKGVVLLLLLLLLVGKRNGV